MFKNLLIRPKNLVPSRKPIRADQSQDSATVWLYDVIDEYFGIDPAEFCMQIAGLNVSTIYLRINCPGGDVFGARAMIAALRGSGAKVIACIDALAASAGTFIAVNCDEVRIADGAFFMIHQASCPAYGCASDLREVADLLDKVDSTIVADFVRKTGKSEEQVRNWMAAETWFTAQEAVTNGFADTVVTGQAIDNSAWDFSRCRHAPDALTHPKTGGEVHDPAPENELTPENDKPDPNVAASARESARRVVEIIRLGC